MSNAQPTQIPVYFSHSYRAEDRDVNIFFWEMLSDHGFLLTIDQQSDDVLSVPYLELMMRHSACFVAIVTLRAEEKFYLCSRYISFEYSLAARARLPHLIFVEQGVNNTFFGGQACVYFNRQLLQNHKTMFEERIEQLRARSITYTNVAMRGRGPVGIALPGRTYAPLIDTLKTRISDIAYTPQEAQIDFEDHFELEQYFSRFDFVVLDVNPAAPTAWLYPFLHGRFIPTIRLWHDTNKNMRTDQSITRISGIQKRKHQNPIPLLRSKLLRKDTTAQNRTDEENMIIFWQESDELLRRLDQQLNKFRTNDSRPLVNTRQQSLRYFHRLGRADRRVFISNANSMNTFAKELTRELEEQGIEYFHYQHNNTLTKGAEWETQIPVKVEESQIFIALIDQHYWSSEHCRKEYDSAREKGRKIIPFLLEDTPGNNPSSQGRSLVNVEPEKRVPLILQDLDDILVAMKSEGTPKRTLSEDVIAHIDIAIITILPEEYDAVRGQFDRLFAAPSATDRPNLYAWCIGEIDTPNHAKPYKVILTLADYPGIGNAALVVMQTIDRWKPRYVLVVGIAGGIAGNNVKLGDVVVSDVIWNYEYGKIATGFQPRNNFTYPLDPALISAARALKSIQSDWAAPLVDAAPEPSIKPDIHTGPIASGDKVIDDLNDPFVVRVLEHWPQIIAVEMEGAGAAKAIHTAQSSGAVVGFGMIRGISDLPRTGVVEADKSNRLSQAHQRDRWKRFAARAAARFACSLIRSHWPVPPYE